MKKEYFKPEIEVIKLASESIANGTNVSSIQKSIKTLSFKNNTITY
ncbi:MAG: hypothetical protein LIO44_01835 [Eubacterium sp.]|nr:hypothetical protein [Eubacterium sp.]